jgi:hypothetical protein
MPTADSRSTSDQAPWSRRPLGRTGLEVTPVCIGGGTLGSMPATFGYEVPADRGVATVRRVLRGPVNFLDTSANHGDGESERRIGAALAEVGGVPGGFVLATKVDRDSASGDFSGDQVRRSAEGSLERLGLDRVQLLYLMSRYLRTGAFEVLITRSSRRGTRASPPPSSASPGPSVSTRSSRLPARTCPSNCGRRWSRWPRPRRCGSGEGTGRPPTTNDPTRQRRGPA